MEELIICRICVRTQCKVYKYDCFQLKSYYEAITGQQIHNDDILPQYFCFECATLLRNYHKFKKKCHTGQKALKEVTWKGKLTYDAVYKIDRKQLKLISSLSLLKVSPRVHTFDFTEPENSNQENKQTDEDSEWVEDEKEISLNEIKDGQIFYDEGTKIEENLDDNTDNDSNENDFDDNYEDSNYVPTEEIKEEIACIDEPIDSTVADESKTVEEIVENNVDYEEIKKEWQKGKKLQENGKKEELKERKKFNAKSKPEKDVDEFGMKKQNPNFRKQKTRFLDMNSWEKYTLSEEDAVQDFKKRANDSKYRNAQYKCDDCFKGFSRCDIFVRHKQRTHDEHIGKLECRFCRQRFKWDWQLRKHLRSHFLRYKCLVCHIVLFEEYNAMLHEDYHKGVKKICKHCGEEFNHTNTYYTHLRTHRSEYVCALCGMSFVSELGLHIHKRRMHVNNVIEIHDDDVEVNKFCEKCNIRFETRPAFVEHLFQSTMHAEGAEEEAPEESLLKKLLEKKTVKDTLKRRITEEDFSEEKKSEVAKKGRREMRRKKPTTCHQCGKHFRTQAECMKHHLSEHPRTCFFPDSERHICEICGASLAPYSIKSHQNIHTREKEHPCETCGRRFHSSAGLKRHIVSHTGEKPYPCTLCDKRFTQSNSMKLHYRTFHLKLPYPKRNRRKKGDPPEKAHADTSSDESEDGIP